MLDEFKPNLPDIIFSDNYTLIRKMAPDIEAVLTMLADSARIAPGKFKKMQQTYKHVWQDFR